MTISYAEAIAQAAEHMAQHDVHGYSQPNRQGHGVELLAFSDGTPYKIAGGDSDCSEMVSRCVAAAGLLPWDYWDRYIWTGNEDEVLTGVGFTLIPLSSKRRGDVLWKTGHTGVYLGYDLMADAHGDEYGGITGPNEGDQTGREIEIRSVYSCSWERCYRPPAGNVASSITVEPTPTGIAQGVDFSNNNGSNGVLIAQNVDCGFMIVKTSQGTGFVDKFAKANADAIVAAGRLLGFFHYANPGTNAEEEAEHFVRCADATGHLAEATLWLDFEEATLVNGPEWAERFMRRVDELTGKTCGFYSYKSAINSYDFSASAHRPLWGAQYAYDTPIYGWRDDPWQSSQEWGAWGTNLAIHQYSANCFVPGFNGGLDVNRGYFTAEQWAEWASMSPQNPVQEPQPGEQHNNTSGWEVEPVTPTRYTFTGTYNIRTAPSMDGGVVGHYYEGEHVTIDGVVLEGLRVWGHYIGASSGEDRYVCIGHLDVLP